MRSPKVTRRVRDGQSQIGAMVVGQFYDLTGTVKRSRDDYP